MAALLLLLLVASCLPSGPPPRPEPQRRQQRLLRASFPEAWRATRSALGESRLQVTDAEEPAGVLRAALGRRRRSAQEPLEPELQRVGDLAAAKRRGLQDVSEYRVQYAIELARIGEQETRVEVSTRITAVDRSEAVVLPGGFVQAIPRSFDVPSNGTLERELVGQIGGYLFISEEMLYYLGVLGRD